MQNIRSQQPGVTESKNTSVSATLNEFRPTSAGHGGGSEIAMRSLHDAKSHGVLMIGAVDKSVVYLELCI